MESARPKRPASAGVAEATATLKPQQRVPKPKNNVQPDQPIQKAPSRPPSAPPPPQTPRHSEGATEHAKSSRSSISARSPRPAKPTALSASSNQGSDTGRISPPSVLFRDEEDELEQEPSPAIKPKPASASNSSRESLPAQADQKRRTPLIWTPEMSICLAKEVQNQKPHLAAHKKKTTTWNAVVESLKSIKGFAALRLRSATDHMKLLGSKFQSKTPLSTGTEKQNETLKHYVARYVEELGELKDKVEKSKRKKEKHAAQVQKGKSLREKYARELQQKNRDQLKRHKRWADADSKDERANEEDSGESDDSAESDDNGRSDSETDGSAAEGDDEDPDDDHDEDEDDAHDRQAAAIRRKKRKQGPMDKIADALVLLTKHIVKKKHKKHQRG